MKIAWFQNDIIWHGGNMNLQKIEQFVDKYDKPFDVLVLPEMFDTGFAMEPSEVDRAQYNVGDWLQEKARLWNCTIMGSSIAEDNNQYFNRMFVTNGVELLHYDKNYLFGMGGEGRNYTAGSERKIIPLNDINILPLICYDLRFPEISRHSGEVDVIIYVASWPVTRIKHWLALLQARAIENQSYVLGVNRIGQDGNGLHYNGMSTMFSYDGSALVSSRTREGIFSHTIDIYSLHNYRDKFPFLKDVKK